jgi:general secretion pathway protein A
MYAQFFGLSREPFSIAPDPRYLYMSERHREALAHLLYGVKGGGGGFVLLTGEIGAGKTTVCRCLLEQIPRRCNIAYIFNPKQTVEELLLSVCGEFHIPIARLKGPHSLKDLVDALNEYLLRTHAVGQNNVLIIDEAQNLSADVLEQLRLLTNLETNERKLLQIILIGQPELRDMLERPELEQLAQRVVARYHLKALGSDETAGYIRHRLEVAGLSSALPFTDAAVQKIHEISRGVPRRINLLCDRALLGAYARGRPAADERIVEKAASEVFGTPRHDSRRALALRRDRQRMAIVLLAGLLIGLALAGGYAWLQGSHGTNPPPTVTRK